jgi:hypothetical protein
MYVHNCTSSRINTYFPLWYDFIFNLRKKKRLIRYVHILYYKILWLFSFHVVSLNTIILELLACGWCWCKLVSPVPTLTSEWSCPSLLLVELFIDSCTLFPWVLVGLAALIWVLGLGFSVAHMLTCHYEKQTIIHTVRWAAHRHIFLITLNIYIIGGDQTDLLFLTPSVRHSRTDCQGADVQP